MPYNPFYTETLKILTTAEEVAEWPGHRVGDTVRIQTPRPFATTEEERAKATLYAMCTAFGWPYPEWAD